MNKYAILKPEDIKNIFALFDKLESEDPDFSIKVEKLSAIAREYKVDLKHLLSVVALLDYFSHNSSSIDIKDIESVIVERQYNNWSFRISRTRGQTVLYFEHALQS